MRGFDTNILVYAHRAETVEHLRALELLREAAEGVEPWGVAWPSLYEFVRVVTHPKVFSPPTTMRQAVGFIEALIASPSLRLLGHGAGHWDWFKATAPPADARGNLVFDAQIAALLLEHGFSEIVTADGDMHRFKNLGVVNPFEG